MKIQNSFQTHGRLRPIGRILKVILGIVLALSAGACGTGAVLKSNMLKQNPASGQLLDVNGHKLHIYCTGDGSPTVILAAGLVDFLFSGQRRSQNEAKL